MARMLRLPMSPGTGDQPGLILLQIDGLSHGEFERALAQGELPFLRDLLRHQHYRLHRMYSGIPSSTATVQGELFYGAHGGVAGFNFVDSGSGRLVRMFEPATAAQVERRLAQGYGEPLLKDGSCYADNFTGGAAEAHYCPAARGWGPSLRDAGLFKLLLFVMLNLFSFLRIAVLLVVELVLAIIDGVRGLLDGQDLCKELKFIPMRVGVAVLLRELSTIGVKMDAARGLPIIHANFLGYDEQSHRRGPSSRFAHWTLKGIDNAIARIARAAERSERRHYELWVYSDHGQAHTRSYEKIYGRKFTDAVAQTFAAASGRAMSARASSSWSTELRYARVLGEEVLAMTQAPDDCEPDLMIAPLGPVAMIYCREELSAEQREAVALALVREAGVPLLLARDGQGAAFAWTAQGVFMLPADGARVLGADHPFLNDVVQDLIALCHHDDAGSLIACGWREGMSPLSFAVENGAHGGFAPEETSAFALLPEDAPLPIRSRAYLRVGELRSAALQLLGRGMEARRSWQRVVSLPTAATVRVMTYNVHSCIGMDGRMSPERIARTIARYGADVIALQELDVRRSRTGGVDQAERIAQLLEMDFYFHPALHLEEERYGDAILSRLPMRLVKAELLPGLSRVEPRGALWVAIDAGVDASGEKQEIQVLNTHLGLTARERRMQIEALLGAGWLAHPQCVGPLILCGDFNMLPSSPVSRLLRSRLRDAHLEYTRHPPRGTFSGRFPLVRLDYIFVSQELDVLKAEVPETSLTRVASDHLPLIVELRVKASTQERPLRNGCVLTGS
jgi:endonuclease/exonuclease/phosphatase family metal-dependent hydrolase